MHRQKGTCKNQFGDPICNECKFYLHKYGTFTQSDAELMMMQAEGSMYSNDIVARRLIILPAIFILCTLIIPWMCSELGDTPPPAAVIEEHHNIEQTLDTVALMMRVNADVNGDRKINCIDAAVHFYQYYPLESRHLVRIISNRNPATGMHHLFNSVLSDGVMHYIEPQAQHSGHRLYHMTHVWGSRYNPSLNRDVTNDYAKYIRGGLR